jgi:hypothetical protein
VLAHLPKRTEEEAMIDRSVAGGITTLAWLCWAIHCGPYDSNTWPLAFGMTPEHAAAALGVPLTYYSGPHGSEIYVARRFADIPGTFPADNAIVLQFRRGHLTGWKQDTAMRKPWIVY